MAHAWKACLPATVSRVRIPLLPPLFMNNFVSRAGDKLDHALKTFGIDVAGKVCADLGANTGGFTDCLLKRSAKKVFSVETGYGVLDWGLRNDPRVVVMERTNALRVELPELVDFICIDVSWTRQKLIVPKALELLNDGGDIVTLIKPHYEASEKYLVKGKLPPGVVGEIVSSVVEQIRSMAEVIGGPIESPLVGKKGGNTEYLLHIRKK